MRECGRRSSMIIAEKSMHQKAIGTFAKMIHASKYTFGERQKQVYPFFLNKERGSKKKTKRQGRRRERGEREYFFF